MVLTDAAADARLVWPETGHQLHLTFAEWRLMFASWTTQDEANESIAVLEARNVALMLELEVAAVATHLAPAAVSGGKRSTMFP